MAGCAGGGPAVSSGGIAGLLGRGASETGDGVALAGVFLPCLLSTDVGVALGVGEGLAAGFSAKDAAASRAKMADESWSIFMVRQVIWLLGSF